jgi:hypothetical protein
MTQRLLTQRRVLFESWLAPSKIEIKDSCLFYEFRSPRLVKWGPGLLKDFVELADVSRADFPTKVEAYAHRWGVLELCGHGWPIGHPNSADAQWPTDAHDYCASDPDSSSEPLDWWRFWSRQARALLSATAATRQRTVGWPEDWIIFLPALPASIREIEREYGEVNAPTNRAAEEILAEHGWFAIRPDANGFREISNLPLRKWRRLIASIEALGDDVVPLSGGDRWKKIALMLNHWLTLGHPQQFCTAQGGRLRRVMAAGTDRDHGGLFAALAAELLSVIPEPWGVFLCTSCGVVTIPQRRPSRGRRYCEKCGIRAAWRDAQRRFRAKRSGLAK